VVTLLLDFDFKRISRHHIKAYILAVLSLCIGVILLYNTRTTFSVKNTVQQVIKPSELNYFFMYGSFLIQKLGFLLPLSFVGAVILSLKKPRVVLPIIFGILLFIYIICYRTQLFAFRYTIPILPFILLASAQAIAFPIELFLSTGRPSLKLVYAALFVVLSFFAVWHFQWNFIPCEKCYELGYTAPQPRWKDAFVLIKKRQERVKGSRPAIVSPYPMYYDIYLGSDFGQKLYIPISWTGYPGSVRWNPPYSEAIVIRDLSDMLDHYGYAILDNMALNTLAIPSIRHYFLNTRPNAIIPGKYPIYIWVLNGPRRKK
jgi:hypothetical protein